MKQFVNVRKLIQSDSPTRFFAKMHCKTLKLKNTLHIVVSIAKQNNKKTALELSLSFLVLYSFADTFVFSLSIILQITCWLMTLVHKQ